jgi:uncharacterized protein (TIGR03435 family)
MKPDKNNVEQFLDRYLPSAAKEEMEADGARVLQQLRLEADPQPEPAGERAAEFDLWRPHRAWWQLMPVRAAAALVFLALLAIPLMKVFVFPEKVYAVVERVTGSVYQFTNGEQRVLTGGERIEPGIPVRTNGEAGAVLKLPDGAQIEMHSKSELSLEQARDGVNIRLNDGSVNVTPAKEPAGNLYVQNRQGTVPVVGAMFQSAGISEPVVAQQAPEERLAFEVASVKLAADANNPVSIPGPGQRGGGLVCQGIDSSSSVTGAARGRCVGRGGLRALVAGAYGVPPRNVIGDAGFAGPPFPVFQIEGKAQDPATATTAQLRQMFQTLLTERFKLKSHRETQESQQYVLAVARSGHKLQPTAGPEQLPRLAPPGLTIRGKSEIAKLAEFLVAMVGFPVLDRTSLAGMFDYTLTLNIVAGQRGGGGGIRGAGGGGGGISVTEFDPPVSIALQEQLGLSLEMQKVSVEVIVIDGAEMPSEN